MADIMTFTEEQQASFDQWVKERPPVIQDMVRKCPPTKLYFNTAAPGQRVTIIAYGEDQTVRVLVSGQYNFVTFEREVFGVPIADLVECDLPGPDELVGVMMTEREDIDTFIDKVRPVIMAGREIDGQSNR